MRSRRLIVVTVVAVVLSGCGDDSEQGGLDPASTADASVETTAVPNAADDVADETTAEESVEEPEAAGALPAGSGRADPTISGETVAFTELTCLEGSIAAELGEDEDLMFAAFADDDTGQLSITVSDKGFDMLEIFYVLGDDSGTWYSSAAGVEGEFTLEDGLISSADDFEFVVDRAEVDRVAGQLEASWG